MFTFFVLTATLAACSGYSPKSNFTLPSVPFLASDSGAEGGDGKASVLLSASVAGLTCAESRIVLARADGDGYKTAQVLSINSQFGGGAAAVVADLTPGTYHIVDVACRNGNNVVSVGAVAGNDMVPWKPEKWSRALASFALANGEVLDAGQLTVTAEQVKGFTTGLSNRRAKASVEASGTAALAEATRLRPELAATLHSSLMTIVDGGPLLITKCKLTAPDKALPSDGSSKVPELVAQNPVVGALLSSVSAATRDADRCVSESKMNDQLMSAAAGAAAAAAQ